MRERYGDSLLTLFNPDNQARYCTDLERVYMGTAPALGLVRQAYGDAAAESWLEIQLEDLSEFAGCRDKLTPVDTERIARVILSEFGYMKLTEFMHFFLQFKAGKYGHFYGAVDGMKITEALQQFARERYDTICRYEAEREKRERAEKKARDLQAAADFDRWLECNGIALSDYLYMRDYGIEKSEMPELVWLLRLGYEHPNNPSKTIAQMFGRK